MWKIVFLTLFLWPLIDCKDFCHLSCGAEHFVCKLKPCSPSIICGRRCKVKRLNRSDRKKLLVRFNEVRDNVAGGFHYSLFNIMSDGMHAVAYDKELEFLAQCWANFCKGRNVRDTCRSTSYSDNVGSVSYVFTNSLPDTDNSLLALDEALLAWTSPQSSIDERLIAKYSSKGVSKNMRNFLQVVVGSIQYVGCGRIIYGLQKYIYIVCYFSPGNLTEDTEVYSRGMPNCHDNLEPYKYLCGKIYLNSYRKFHPPFKEYLQVEAGNLNVINKKIVIILVIILFVFA